MEINNFDGFEQELLIAYLNHRYGEPAIEVLPLFILTQNDQLWMSLTELHQIFGAEAGSAQRTVDEYGNPKKLFTSRLHRWFDIEEGSHKSGLRSRLTLKTGTEKQIELYNWLKERNLVDELRRDKDGIFDSWVDMAEWKIECQKMADHTTV